MRRRHLATNWVSVADALKGIDWRGRILIDATNAHVDPVPDISLAGVTRSRAALKGRTSSEMVAEMAVGARLVKSISNMPMAWIQDFSPNKPRTVIFTSGDDPEAKQLVMELINSTGLVATDLGSLATGGAMHEVGAPHPASNSTSSGDFGESALNGIHRCDGSVAENFICDGSAAEDVIIEPKFESFLSSECGSFVT
jgi:predicted dinucleotide-binding enzyme